MYSVLIHVYCTISHTHVRLEAEITPWADAAITIKFSLYPNTPPLHTDLLLKYLHSSNHYHLQKCNLSHVLEEPITLVKTITFWPGLKGGTGCSFHLETGYCPTALDLMANLYLKSFFFLTLGVGQTVKVLPQRESVRLITICAKVKHRQ